MRLALFSLLAGAFATAVGAIVTACLALPIAAILGGANIPLAILGSILFAPLPMMVSVDAMWEMLPTIAPLAALVGGTAHMLGRSRPWLNRRLVWAGAGALLAWGAYAAMKHGLIVDSAAMLDMLGPGEWELMPVALGGAAAALSFRAGLRILDVFFPPADPAEEP